MKKNRNKILEIINIIIYSIMLNSIMLIMANNKIYNIIIIFISNNEWQYIVLPIIITFVFILLVKQLCNDLFKANLITTIIFVVIAIISYYKINRLSEPFIPSDILLIKNVKEIATYGLTSLPVMTVLGIILLMCLLILQYLKKKKINKDDKIKENKNIIIRIIITVIGVLILIYICINPKRFEKLGIKNSLGDDYNWMGAHTVFFMHLGDFYTEKPANYSEENVKAIENEYQTDITNQNAEEPNVIFIMNESFFDPNAINAVEYSKDPIGDIKSLAYNNDNCKIGDIISPVAFGGTSLPEFEALTGLSSYYLEPQTYPYTSAIRGDTNSIVRLFRKNEYDTIAIHPYKAGFYNRKNVYDYLGFNKKIFEENMENPEYSGLYISDNELSNQIINEYEASNSEKKFIFGVSMQNHIPYMSKEYKNYDVEITSSKLSEYDTENLKKCIQGIYDANKMYIKLAEYINSIDKNTILIMFGDHIPYLTEYNAYISSGYEGIMYNTTPYIVYSNYDIDLSNFPNTMAPCNLGINVAKLANLELPWYLKTFNNLYQEYPVFSNNYIVDKNSKIYKKDIFEEENELIDKCRILQYDIMYKKKYITIEK